MRGAMRAMGADTKFNGRLPEGGESDGSTSNPRVLELAKKIAVNAADRASAAKETELEAIAKAA